MPDTLLLAGDCLVRMRALPEGSVDAVVCDPPYELGFMGKKWDSSGVAFDPSLWREVLRVIKPGGYLLAFGGTRTYHRMTVAIEDAGFEIRDCIGWTYGSGFPKSLNLGDGRGTALKPAWEPIVVARAPFPGTVAANVLRYGTGALNIDGCRVPHGAEVNMDAIQRQQHAAGAIEGAFGAASLIGKEIATYKPGGRWPANLILSHGADCREVGTRQAKATSGIRPKDTGTVYGKTHKSGSMAGEKGVVLGPTYADENGEETVAVWECAPGCPVAALDAQSGVKVGKGTATIGGPPRTASAHIGQISGQARTEAVMDYGDTGGASRFFNQLPIEAEDFVPFAYVAKAGRSEREAGCDALPARTGAEAVERAEGSAGLTPRAGAGRSADKVRNHHPTVKPVSVMRWCIRLVTPPGGVVLDPFMGSGSTGIAAVREGANFIGIEREADYLTLARARIAHAQATPDRPAPPKART